MKRMNATQLLGRYRGELMGFAALWIVIMHCWLVIVPNHAILGAIEGLVKWNGMIGVEMFLFLSGMGLTYAIRKRTLGQFYAGRLKRVLLPYWFMVLLIAVTEAWGMKKTLGFMTGAVFFMENFQALLWYIPAILLLYALFPAYHALMLRARDKTAFTACALGVWLCAAILGREAIRSDVWVFINRIPSFLLGVWIGEIGRERELEMRAEHWALCVITLAGGWMLRIAGNKALVQVIPQFAFAASTLVAVPLCLLLAGLFALMERSAAKKLLAWPLRLLAFVGSFTLELYCSHQWLYGKIYTPLEGKVSYLTINFIAIPLLLFAGWLFYLAHAALWRAAERMLKKK